MEINDFRAVSEVELLAERRIPKPNSYSSLPQSTPKDSSWHRKFRLNRGGTRDGEAAPHQSLSLPASRPASRHSRSSSPDSLPKQRSNSLRHESRHQVFMPGNSNSLPGRDNNVLIRQPSHGSDSSLPSGTSSTHNSLNRVYSAPAAAPDSHDTPAAAVEKPASSGGSGGSSGDSGGGSSPPSQSSDTGDDTYSQYQPQVRQAKNHPPRITRTVPRLPATYSNHTYTNIPPSPTTACSTPATITPSSSVSEDWSDADKQAAERHSVPPLHHDPLHKPDSNPLLTMPWFHSQISRTEAASHVTMGGSDTHGRFLIRKSDTKQGELVLTFNNEGAAKVGVLSF